MAFLGKARMMRRHLVLPVAALLLLSSRAYAQEVVCVDIGNLSNHLATAYGERQAWVGQTPDGANMVLYLSPDLHSWTLAFLLPDGTTACISATGEAWAPTGEPSKKPEERS
jgi:hypothetical protein